MDFRILGPLEDRVADNVGKWEITESESLLFGRNFGLVTDIHTGPDGRGHWRSSGRIARDPVIMRTENRREAKLGHT
jgi:hypothetical protein